MLYEESGGEKSKMAAYKVEIPLYHGACRPDEVTTVIQSWIVKYSH